MFSKTNRTKKSFIGAIAMSLVLLMGSAFGFLLETNLGQITKPTYDVWTNYVSKPTGDGTSESNPYKITTPQELAYLINNLGAGSWYIELVSDIDLGGHEWAPIKTTVGSTVTFKGDGHTISNMKINQPEKNGVGFFEGWYGEFVTAINMSNTIFSNVNILGKFHVGTVAGGSSGIIDSVNVTSGEIIVNEMYAGGIVGENASNGQILNCTNNANIMWSGSLTDWSSGWNLGGIVPQNNSDSRIYNCINTGDIRGKGNLGGLVSQNRGIIDNCVAECAITASAAQSELGDFMRIGGLAGSNYSTISNSGFYGSIQVLNSMTEDSCGSLVGRGEVNLTSVVNCFGVATIRLIDSEDMANVHAFGAPIASEFKSVYSYTKIISSDGIKELRKYKVGADETVPFKDMAYDQHINKGYPFPRALFAVGQFIECDTMSYLEEYGFGKFPFDVKNDGLHYYVELGQYPQSYVGNSLNTTLKSWFSSSSPASVDEFTNDVGENGTITHYAYKYTDGNRYVRVESAIVYETGYLFEDDTAIINGSEYWFKVEPIKWWILNYSSLTNENAYPVLLSERGLTANITWNKTYLNQNLWSGTCDIRTWLNNQFYNDSFDTYSKSLIKVNSNYNNSQSSLNDGSGVNTTDNVWLLSYGEAYGDTSTSYSPHPYLKSDSERRCAPTDYALVHNCYIRTDLVSVGVPSNGTCGYWLRSAYISDKSLARTVAATGSLNANAVTDAYPTIRPALTLKI